MRIFDETKTVELPSVDLQEGRLIPDKIAVGRIEAAPATKEEGHFETIATYENGGKDVKWVVDIPASPAREAGTKYEDIYIFHRFTDEEKKARLRLERKPLLEAFDKWEKGVLRGREIFDEAIQKWYQGLLELDGSCFSSIPDRIRYYL